MNLNVASTTASVPPPSPMPCLSEPAGLVVMGRDEAGRPHASLFGPSDIPAAERAATLMGFRTMRVTEAHHALASSLASGKIFQKSGLAFVPYASKQTYASLLEAAGLPDTPPSPKAASKAAGNPPAPKGGQGGGDTPGGAGGAYKRPAEWADICVGALVLATTGGPQEGWFEAVVRFTKADLNYVLSWRDWPLEPEFTRHVSELALLHPGEPIRVDPS
ncbi:hypothetical protein [Methylobacterium sp. J-090]|uniref:hypothetical protein n=1 Tax=Methylobacterium sp. J-090 TaxID=2836666 RepID=UPI001FB93739|nr:hypothetical protein [Methylobacterium sp. J-090]MCJ2084165.1 hypothetical protein [Methylobacterium sp. J-090]